MEAGELEVAENYRSRTVLTSRLWAGSRRAARWVQGLRRYILRHTAGPPKKLAVRETAALGERRFISVIQFERQRFLIASSAASVSLLAQLPDEPASGCGEEREDCDRQGRRDCGGKV